MELPSDLASSYKLLQRQEGRIIELERTLELIREELRLTRARFFGRSSEKRSSEPSANQLILFSQGEVPVTPEKEEVKVSYTRSKRREVDGALPEGTRFPQYLPREEVIIDDGEGELISERITEKLAVNPNSYYVKRIIRRVRRTPDGSAKTPPAPPEVIERSVVDVSFLIQVIISKFVWHIPLHRQEQMLKAQGIKLSRDTLIRYVITIAGLLKPVYVALGKKLFEEKHIFGDETPVLVGKGERGAKQFTQSYFWTFLGTTGVVFYYTKTRSFEAVKPLIESFKGYLQSDGYSVYEMVATKFPEIVLVGCWAHARRKFVDAEKGGNAPEAKEALRYIRALYRVERRIKEQELGLPEILKLRQRFSKKILLLFERWLKQTAQNPRIIPKSLFSGAVGYTRNRWTALSRYIKDPVLAIDSNAVERQIRPVALGRKIWLFCASEVGAEAAAIIYSLVASCRLANVNPVLYFTDVLQRIADHPASRVEDLIPRNWNTIFGNSQLTPAQNLAA